MKTENAMRVMIKTGFCLVVFFVRLWATEPLPADSPEYYFRFKLSDRAELAKLTRVISIDNVRDQIVYAYANRSEFAEFEKLGYACEVLPHPGTLYHPVMAKSVSEVQDWDRYPTYEAYVAIMNQFAQDFPALCRMEPIGFTVQGRELLAVKLSDNVANNEAEPEVFYTATMHGDETAGWMLMLRLIDSLLSGYAESPRIRNLLDNAEIWINPLANPDGTYRNGNSTVFGATRYNANGADLNRNFPDPEKGAHPDGRVWQAETMAMMDFATQHHLVLSANFHGGAEVVNYPWDTWARPHPDDQWFQTIARRYADIVHLNSAPGYMDDLNNGITNGYAWYEVKGCRQDWMVFERGSRETTIELSAVKLIPETQINLYWQYNRDALLGYLENVFSGIHGTVMDNLGRPLPAKITLVGHDTEMDRSWISTDTTNGDFYRFCAPGNYTVVAQVGNLPALLYENVTVADNLRTTLEVRFSQLALGDVNNDGQLDVRDAVVLTAFSSQKLVPDPQQKINADWNFDGEIDYQDVRNLIEYILGNTRK